MPICRRDVKEDSNAMCRAEYIPGPMCRDGVETPGPMCWVEVGVGDSRPYLEGE